MSQLREDIFNRNSSILSGFVPEQLRLYAYKHEFEQRRSLKPESGIDNLGTNPEDALIVMVPDLATIERARREAELASLAAEMESSALAWLNNTESPIYDLKYRQLKFVYRDESIRLLKEIHQDAFYHPKLSGGVALRIPLINNLEGMGKSQFAAHYISKWAELFKKDDSPFENSL